MVRRRLTGLCLFVALVASSARATADTVFLQSGTGKPVPLEQVKVEGVQDQNIRFTTAAGVSNTKPLDHVPQIRLDNEPAFTAAEDAFAKNDWAGAADNYRKAIAGSTKDWVKDRSSMRLVEAAGKSGNFGDAVAGFIQLMKTKPALATEHKPTIPKNQPTQLDPAIALVKQESTDPKLTVDQKTVLLNYLLEMYSAKGDSASAQAVVQQLGKVMPPPPHKPPEPHLPAPAPALPPTNEPPRVQFEKAIEAARRARDAKIGSAGEEFTVAASDAFRRLNEQRKTEFEIAVVTFDVRIKEITKTGDLDKALAARAERDKYLARAKREDDQLASEWTAINASAAVGALEPKNNPLETGIVRPSIVGQWGWEGRATSDLTFGADGSAACVWWNGKKATWRATDQRTFEMVQPDGKPVTMTITSNDRYLLWDFGDGEVHYLVRQMGAARSAARIDIATAHAALWNAPSVVVGKVSWPARPGGYALSGNIRIGAHSEPTGAHPGGVWSAGTVVAEPGFILTGGVLTASGGSIEFKGTADNPVILKGVRIECELTASIKAENTIFEGCTFQKVGNWFWTNGYSTKWEFTGCVLDRSAFSGLSRMDYGIKFEQCDFRGCKFPQRHWGYQNSEKTSDDGTKLARSEWSQINDCSFYECKVAASVVWLTQRCDFSGCAVPDQEDFASKTDLPVELGVSAEDASFVGELTQKTSHSGVGVVKYAQRTLPRDRTSRSPVWKSAEEPRVPPSETHPPSLFDVPK